MGVAFMSHPNPTPRTIRYPCYASCLTRDKSAHPGAIAPETKALALILPLYSDRWQGKPVGLRSDP